MRTITEIIVHCSATHPGWLAAAPLAAKIRAIRSWHVDGNGWNDIGYHYLVDRDGAVAAGRPVETPGAHVIGHNADTIGVCLLGGHGSAETDAFSDHFTVEQGGALTALLEQLQAAHGPGLKISGHNQYAAKACPGFSVPAWLGARQGQPIAATDPATEVTRYRWRLAEIRDLAGAALKGA
ncbi:N-acetylmuramoyl-L-alanine amidase [Salipiger pallidus]|uniref:N-acetylmuramoyl-L-alanine amidase n=1 Tax=Salipiger pallidus TaxID=1775170 RepID=A0A8J3EFG9_9RHOB|nr:N-acetylmuramoyl-L-alanine amidase [Salipiger pallidus]GGG59679.1 N-acetylmuramoyl-L-alanine amidase [Salipiger pallidus]